MPHLVSFGARARRALRKPPRELARRLQQEARREVERLAGPRRARRLDAAALCRATGARSLDELWERLRSRPYPAVHDGDAARAIGGDERLLTAAGDALARRVDLLGSGPHVLGEPVDWHTDFKTGIGWPLGASRSLDYADLDRPGDVKVPWELSRLQWLLPAGQAYLLTGEERYASGVRTLLEEWLDANPYGRGPNWCVAMEAALRVVSFTWLFHALGGSEAWADGAFRARFLAGVFLNADFVDRNIERSDVNGNHYAADAAGLVFAGLFFGGGPAPDRWAAEGWRILLDELPRQVTPDGVDFEASVPYHRLVAELFAYPALYRRRLGLDVPAWYEERLRAMGAYAAAYTRLDGTSPLWGDADDARVLPLGRGPLGDHRYLAGLAGAPYSGPQDEVAWARGAEEAAALAQAPAPATEGFGEGGFYVLRGGGDHLFADCGPVGLAGRGGHGHSDALAFELALDGVTLVTDSGSYVYTADWRARNAFRGTAYHSTPQVDDGEVNRLVAPRDLWNLRDDAHPVVEEWRPDGRRPRLRGRHAAYLRLDPPVTVRRTLALDLDAHAAAVLDELEGEGSHRVTVPFHLAHGVTATLAGGWCAAEAGGRTFAFAWSNGWEAGLRDGWESPSYGVRLRRTVLELRREGPLTPLAVAVTPADDRPDDVDAFVRSLAGR